MKKPGHVAVNARFLLPEGLEGMGRFSHEILSRMVRNHPDVKFSFFFDRKFDQKYIYAPNVKGYHLPPPARHPLLFIIWFNYSVTRMLKKLQPDVFFSPDGFLSLNTDVPQVPVFHDLAFAHYPEDVRKLESWYYGKYFPRFAEKAKNIITVSEFTKSDVIRQYGVDEDRIAVVHNACSGHFKPLSEAVKQRIRQRFSGGKPFIHFVGAIQPRKNLHSLIRAFSIFKKTDTRDTKLLIVGRKAWKYGEIMHAYEESDYKKDISFTGFVSDEDLSGITASSEALCYIPYFEGFGIPPLEAMQSGTPVIASDVSSIPEVTADAALLVNPEDPQEIAEAINKVLRNESFGAELRAKGLERAKSFSWEESAKKTWEVLCQTYTMSEES